MTDKRFKISLAANLNRLLADRKWTINSTAKKIRMSKSTLHNYCCGILPKNLENLKDLAELFGISLNELILGHKENEHSVIHIYSIDGVYEILVRKKNTVLSKVSLPRGNHRE